MLYFVNKWFQLNDDARIKRTKFINQMILRLYLDQELMDTMHIIEYDDSWYNNSFHNSTNGMEARVEEFLSYLSFVCYLKKMRVMHKEEFAMFEDELRRTCSSPSVRAYLWNLYHFAKKQNIKCTYQFLIDYGIKNNLINKKCFMDSTTSAFPKYLNF